MKQQICYPLIKECHCGHPADKYLSRTFLNMKGYKVIRVFYRCRNCSSRISSDFIPELDALKKVNVLDLIKKLTR